MSDITLTTISDIKLRLQIIREKLFEIPKLREIKIYIKDLENDTSKSIYKPRFSPKHTVIPQDIKLEFAKIVDDIYLYLAAYSPDNLSNLTDILDLSSENRNSLIYLLENDVYQTHNVYGGYLVEIEGINFKIGYYRRNKIVKRLKDQLISIDLVDLIKNDAIHQIQSQFNKMWTIIEHEIERCENRYISQQRIKEEESSVEIKEIIFMKECEYIDFKFDMYLIDSKDLKIKLFQRKEFLKDVLRVFLNL